MAKYFLRGKWKKRAITALSVALSLSLSMGILAACGGTPKEDDDDEEEPAATETDTQLLKNGNFEFYTDKSKEPDDKRTFLYTPSSWSFTSGSPSSDTRSGIVDLNEWETITASKFSLISWKDEESDEKPTEADANKALDYAVAHWDEASIYDRLEFYEKYDKKFPDKTISSLDKTTGAGKLFAEYNYTMDFEDVEKLAAEVKNPSTAHAADEERKDESNVLMIHNYRSSDGVLGTGQYYTSSTTITLSAGTAAEVSVYVRTDNLTHYYSSDPTEVTARAGAYIGVTNTVGGSTLDQMQIKNINTKGAWQKYTVYVRANSYATSTFKLVLGLGQSSSDNRYEAVNGYAFFDDITCKKISSTEYDTATDGLGTLECTVHSLSEEKLFDATKLADEDVFALDLNATDDYNQLNISTMEAPVVTTEVSGGNTYRPPINNQDGDFAQKVSLSNLAANVANNKYLKHIYENDFKDKFPFQNEELVMLLSASGNPYTAVLKNDDEFILQPDSRMLVSFYVKTSAMRTGKSGASITLVDGENETVISAFDSTTVATVDIDDDRKDITKGWVQCFFFVENTTDEAKTFFLKLNYGPTTIAGTVKSDYCDGYAAFANFETSPLSKTQYSYVATNDRAKTVSLTASVSYTAKFDDASITSNIEEGFATPVNFLGVQSGTVNVTPTPEGQEPIDNPTKEELIERYGVYTGLLNAKYASNYAAQDWTKTIGDPQGNGEKWWKEHFGDVNYPSKVANQPLVILNTSAGDAPAYGYFAKSTTISASSYSKISMRVKVSSGAKAFIYLTDTSDAKSGYNKTLAPIMPSLTYWYDDDGNICIKDPADEKFSARNDIAFYKQPNGLYKAKVDDGKYYANLANFKTDENGNLTTDDDTIAYYYNHEDKKFYAYYDKNKGTYSQEVTQLPTEVDGKSILRYKAADMSAYGACIEVEGAQNSNWVDVAFYVKTGSEAKNYRLEVWMGSRDGKTDFPSGSYVFFDDYKTENVSSSYDNLLKEKVANLKDRVNEGKKPGDTGFLGEDDNLTTNAVYYTFTFFDSPSYLRYDETRDVDKLGDPHGSYKQSTYTEQLIALDYSDENEYAKFIDYSASEVDVPEDDLDKKDEDDKNNDENKNDMNIWLLISSGILAGVLVFVIIAIIVRRIVKAVRSNAKPRKKAKKE